MSSPALLHSEKLDAFMMVHVDDFITLGDDEALSEVERVMSSHHPINGSGSPRCRSIDTCVGTPMVKGVELSMNRTLDTLI